MQTCTSLLRSDAVSTVVEDGFLGLDGRASVLTLDGRAASVITKDCSLPVSDVTSKYVCPWTSRIPAVLCRRRGAHGAKEATSSVRAPRVVTPDRSRTSATHCV